MFGATHQFSGHEFEQIPEVMKDREGWRAGSPCSPQRVEHD